MSLGIVVKGPEGLVLVVVKYVHSGTTLLEEFYDNSR